MKDGVKISKCRGSVRPQAELELELLYLKKCSSCCCMIISHKPRDLLLSVDAVIACLRIVSSGTTCITRKWLATRLPRGRLQLLDTDNHYRILQWAAITASSPADCRLPGPLRVSGRHARPEHLVLLLLHSSSAAETVH